MAHTPQSFPASPTPSALSHRTRASFPAATRGLRGAPAGRQGPWGRAGGGGAGRWSSAHVAPRLCLPSAGAACKRKEQEQRQERALQPKKQRLVFTDLQRRTLVAIFKENKRPSKEMQLTISQQLGLELNTVSNFFMNARRRCVNRWAEEPGAAPAGPAAAATFSKA